MTCSSKPNRPGIPADPGRWEGSTRAGVAYVFSVLNETKDSVNLST